MHFTRSDRYKAKKAVVLSEGNTAQHELGSNSANESDRKFDDSSSEENKLLSAMESRSFKGESCYSNL